jgi:hypothetical protein
MKNKAIRWLVLAAVAAVVCLVTNNAAAQGNFDPAEWRREQMERYRTRIEVKAEDDWKKIEPLIGKVMDAQRDVRMGAGFGGGNRRSGDNAESSNRNRNRFGQPSPESEALQKALEDKAPADEVKAKLAKYREARKSKEAALEKAQEDLRKALSPRQEAAAVLAGLLK